MESRKTEKGDIIKLGKFWLIVSYDDVQTRTNFTFSGTPDKKDFDQLMSFITITIKTISDPTFISSVIQQAAPGLKPEKAMELAKMAMNFDTKGPDLKKVPENGKA